jgi:DNA mismatch endonuclease (patch repair protein)
MSDWLTPDQRSAHMARIRRSDTRPERVVRRVLTELGYRYRVQLAGVPGRPDIAFTARRKAIFVHGCFWHAHAGCSGHHVPKTRSDFWLLKFAKNKARDQRLLEAAQAAGWETLVIWECELKDKCAVAIRLRRYLGHPRAGLK